MWQPRNGVRWPVRVTVAAAVLAGCATLGVRTDYDRDVVFTGYRTWAWADSAGVIRDTAASPFLARRVRRAVERALEARGFVATPDSVPGFLITALVIGPAPEQARWQFWPAAPCGHSVAIGLHFGYPYGYGFRPRHWPWRRPWFMHPWGYACSYRIGYGYLWMPVYLEPDDRLAGTLVIDILNPGSRDLLWRGSLDGAVVTPRGEAASQEELDAVALRILREFPPRGTAARE